MAGKVRDPNEPFPSAYDRKTNPPPHIPGFTAEQDWAYAHPEPPKGYTWTSYVKAVTDAQAEGREGPRPLSPTGQDMAGDMAPAEWLQHSYGYARLAPLLDSSDPQVQAFLGNQYYQGTATDDWSFFGDALMPVLAGLGAAVGGAAAFGAFAPEAAAGAAGAGAAGAGEAAAGAAGTGATIGGYSTIPSAAELLTAYGGANAATPLIASGGAAAGAGAGAGALGSLGSLLGLGGGAGGTLGSLAPLLGAGISAGTSILGGALAGGAARDAAETQAGAADRANQTLWDIYNQQRTDMLPYMGAGYAALGQLSGMADNPLTADTYTAPAGLDPSQYAFNTGQYAFQAPNQALQPTGQYAPLDPTGQYAALDPGQYAFNPPSGQDVLNQDPGYAFRVQQGQRALESGAAARGGLLSGGTQQALVNYGQGAASQEYQNAYNRLLAQNQLAYGRGLQQNQDIYGRGLTQNQDLYSRARYGNETEYNRALAQNQMGYERGLTGNQLDYGRASQLNQDTYQRQLQQYLTNYNAQLGLRNQQTSLLGTLAGYGTNALGQQNQLGANLGSQVAGNITSAGAAQAAGQVGQMNNITSGLAGVGGAVGQYLNYNYLQNQLAQQNQNAQLLQQLLARR
jgi:hypothetical protein